MGINQRPAADLSFKGVSGHRPGAPFSASGSEEFQGDSVYALLESMGRPRESISYPRRDQVDGSSVGEITIRLLSDEEQKFCIAAADAYVRELKLPPGPGFDDAYRNALSLEIVQRACLSTERLQKDEERPFFPPSKLLRARLTKDERDYLIGAYLALQATKGAVKEEIHEQDVDFYCDYINANPVECLASLSYEAMVSLMQLMAKRITSVTPEQS